MGRRCRAGIDKRLKLCRSDPGESLKGMQLPHHNVDYAIEIKFVLLLLDAIEEVVTNYHLHLNAVSRKSLIGIISY